MPAKRIVIFGFAQSVHIQRWVAGLQSRGYEIKLISLGGEKLVNTETVVFPYDSRAEYIWRSGDAVREAKAFKPDIVHVHYAGGFGLWSWRMRFKPTVVSIWGSDLNEFSKTWSKRIFLRAALNQATALTVTSRYLLERTTSLFHDLEKRLEFIPFGVELPTEIPPLPVGPPKICYIKQHEPTYAPDVLIQAIAEAKKEIPDIRLSMAGTGSMTAQLQELTSSLGLEDQVKFVGWLDNQWVYHFISEHNFMAMPSRQEAFGVAALEAAACGRPVIGTTVGGIPEVILNNLSGILVPPDNVTALAEAIVKLAKDRALQQQMGEAGQRYVLANYTWEKSLDLMCALYERVLHEARR